MTERNGTTVMAVAGDFQRSYDPAFAWKTATAAVLALPGLRGFWPMSAFHWSGAARDQSGLSWSLAYNGALTYNAAGLIPYIEFVPATSDYLSQADNANLDITGLDGKVTVEKQGKPGGVSCAHGEQ